MSVSDSLLLARVAQPPRDDRFVSLLRRALQEPLLHFLLLGALIFVLADLHKGADQQYRIVIDRARVEKLAQTYAQQFGGRPTPQMLRTLIENDINEEVLYREGLAMRLDQDDEVIRRRVVQKAQFLEQDLNPPAAPGDAALRAFYDQHQARYIAPARIAFSHIFFSPDKGGDAKARARAAATLAALDAHTARAPELGDAYPDLYDYSAIGSDDAVRLFGETEMARAIFHAPLHRWAGPYHSGYGWHLVYVSTLEPAHLLAFADAREQVRSDYQADSQSTANARNFAAIKSRYTIVREDGQAPR